MSTSDPNPTTTHAPDVDAPATKAHATTGGTSDPEQLRAEIEDTRRELGETVAALSAKTDVKAQAHLKVDEVKAAVGEKREELLGKKNELLGRARGASPDSALAAASSTSAKVRQNPLPAAVAGAFVGGFVLGRLKGSRS
jgi:ElaB/YqjD/DUF883 family membrane-anchored ribosome-binding protein